LDHFKKNLMETKNVSNQFGFTLVEVLIAIVIMAFITLYAYKMIDEGTDTKDRVTTEDRNLMQTQVALNRIESDFNEYYSPLFSQSKQVASATNDPYQDTNTSFNGPFEGKAKSGIPIPQVFSENKSEITFLTQVNRRKVADSKESNFVWVKYSLRASTDEEDKLVGGMDLVRQTIATNPFSSNLNWNDVRPQILLSNVKTLEISYWDTVNKKYVQSLSDLGENKNVLRAIKVIFTWINKDKNEFKFEKTLRVINPYFNTKNDDLKTNSGGSWGDSAPPSGVSTPDQSSGSGDTGAKF
jgi:prepilin-type N-terminal cleavage/methylation domain-containing protein